MTGDGRAAQSRRGGAERKKGGGDLKERSYVGDIGEAESSGLFQIGRGLKSDGISRVRRGRDEPGGARAGAERAAGGTGEKREEEEGWLYYNPSDG